MTIPENIRILFDDFCEGCELCKVITEDYEEQDENGYDVDRTVISCDHIEACSRAFYVLHEGEPE